LIDQASANLERFGDRLSEIHQELQTAIREKIEISKGKMNELRSEVRTIVQEIESFGKLVTA
jgi:Na+/phosphate symporter